MRRDVNECNSGFISAHHLLFYAKLELGKIIKQIIIYILDCNLEIKPLQKGLLVQISEDTLESIGYSLSVKRRNDRYILSHKWWPEKTYQQATSYTVVVVNNNNNTTMTTITSSSFDPRNIK